MIRRPWRYLPTAFILIVLTACGGVNTTTPPSAPATQPPQSIETLAPIEVTRLVVVSPTPAPTQPAGNGTAVFRADDPTSLRHVTADAPQTLDPVLATDGPGLLLLSNVVEPLLFPHPEEPGAYLPLLATDWSISEDGLTVTFSIRPGVTFSDGSALTATDIAYSIQRALLLSPPAGPQGQLLEPLLGFTSNDITEEISSGVYAGNRDALIANADPEELAALCERVKEAVTPDDAAGTLTFSLTQSWGALLATLSQPWTGAIDREWAIARGAWDDSCETWQNWYAPAPGESALEKNVMGTGPYVLDHWTSGVEYLLLARPDYWRNSSEPLWDAEDAPAGPPAISSVRVQFEPDAAIRLALLQHGAVSIADIAPPLRLLADQGVGELCADIQGACSAGAEPGAPLRKLAPLPARSRTDLLFNFAVTGESNPYLGSGQLDGNGIPADFFSDFNVRRGFSHCVDAARLIENVYFGLGIPNNSVIPPFLLGYNPGQESRTLDLERCGEELRLAWDGQLANNGFRLQAPFVSGNRAHEVVLASLQENLQAADSRYRLETVGLPEPLYSEALQSGQLPLLFLTWSETLRDPHNWTVPYFLGPYTEYQALPDNVREQFALLALAGVADTSAAGRDRIYSDLGRVRHSVAPNIIFPQAGDAQYQQRWITRWLIHPATLTAYYYGYAIQ